MSNSHHDRLHRRVPRLDRKRRFAHPRQARGRPDRHRMRGSAASRPRCTHRPLTGALSPPSSSSCTTPITSPPSAAAISGESGHNARQGEVAALMFRGTVDLVAAIEADDFAPRVYFNPQGAKHHAQFDTSSGFCVFNDMAWAAHHFAAQGKRVAYLDWDIHHGDGVEDLTRSSASILDRVDPRVGDLPRDRTHVRARATRSTTGRFRRTPTTRCCSTRSAKRSRRSRCSAPTCSCSRAAPMGSRTTR